MRALRFHRFGGPDVLTVDELPLPAPGAGEVLVRVRYGGLNFADTERRRGLYLADLPLPDTLGFEAAGVVEAVGEGVDPAWRGRRVALLAPRAHAEAVAVPVARLIAIPEALDDVTAAAFPVQGLTAWHLVHTIAQVEARQTVCIHSAAGGVGRLAVQWATRRGARVVATVSRADKVDAARSAGAAHVVLRHDAWADEVLGVTQGRGVHVVLDAVGAATARGSAEVLAPRGRWVIYGSASGAAPPLAWDWLVEKSASVQGFWLRTPMEPATWERGVASVLSDLEQGVVQVDVAEVGPLDQAARLHAALEGGTTTGKRLLDFR